MSQENAPWLRIQAYLHGLLSNSSVLIFFGILFCTYILRFFVLNYNQLPFKEFLVILMVMLFIAIMVVLLIVAYKSSGQVGPPEAEIRQGDKYLKITNTTLNLALVLQYLIPERNLPPPDALIEGDLKNKEEVILNELTPEQQEKWTKNDQIETIQQALKEIKDIDEST